MLLSTKNASSAPQQEQDPWLQVFQTYILARSCASKEHLCVFVVSMSSFMFYSISPLYRYSTAVYKLTSAKMWQPLKIRKILN